MAQSRRTGRKNENGPFVSAFRNMTGPTAFFLVLAVIALLNNCNRWATVTNSSGDLVFTSLPGESFVKKGRFFIVFPNDTTLLAGVRRDTTVINGKLTSATEDSVYYQTITMEQAPISLAGKTYTVYPQMENQGKSLGQLKKVATRYFELTKSQILLRGFSAGGPLIQENDTLVMPHVLTADLTWSVPLLVSLPEKYFQPGISLHGTALVVEFDAEIKIDSVLLREGLLVRLFYELSGGLVEDDSITRVIGTLSIDRYYIKDIGLINQKILSQIQTVSEGGGTEVKKELLLMKRNPRNLQSVPEQYIQTK